MLTTPKQIEYFSLLQMRGCLEIEIATGMRHSRGSILNLVNRRFGWTHRTKKAALKALNELIEEKKAEL